MSADPLVSVQGVSKSYRIWKRPGDRLAGLAWEAAAGLGVLRGVAQHRLGRLCTDFQALQPVSFELRPGDSLGIVGRNGSGKSTLLQILAGTLQPSTGCVAVRGRISALLELGAGFNPEFTGRENARLGASLAGLDGARAEALLPVVEEFAEIGAFFDQPVKTYSSGMFARLAFAVAIATEPDVLIVDEALSVGDVFFQQKCFRRVREILGRGVAFIFVSHDFASVESLCRRAILLDRGAVVHDGSPDECRTRYYAMGGIVAQVASAAVGDGAADLRLDPAAVAALDVLPRARNRHGPRGLEFRAVALLDRTGAPLAQVPVGETVSLHAVLRATRDIAAPAVGVQLFDRGALLVFAAGNRQLGVDLPALREGDELDVVLDLTLDVGPGTYTLTLDCSEPSAEGPNLGVFQDVVEGLGPVHVTADPAQMWKFYGVARLPLQLGHRRRATA
jgi:ABC-type polysaccharide/polyol phosphate transport system ATPase subunit